MPHAAAIVEERRQGRTVAIAFHGSLYPDRMASSDGVVTMGAEAVVRSLLERYLASGMSFLRDLRGEFAIAVRDTDGDRMFLATDRCRVQPLLYSLDPTALLFASRMRGV